jgi:protein-S-isoprenylcysteine O-methyltransferase Ste14
MVKTMRGSANRRRRVSRRMERDTFREVIMPAGYLAGALGLLGVLAVALHYSVTGTPWLEVAGLALSLVAIPCALQVYRVLRGHYSDSLNEP